MKTLSEHNKEKWASRKPVQEFGTGVACNKCGSELLFSGSRFMSSPPKSAVHCPNKECTEYMINKGML